MGAEFVRVKPAYRALSTDPTVPRPEFLTGSYATTACAYKKATVECYTP